MQIGGKSRAFGRNSQTGKDEAGSGHDICRTFSGHPLFVMYGTERHVRTFFFTQYVFLSNYSNNIPRVI